MRAIAVMIIGVAIGYVLAQKPAKREPVRTTYADRYFAAWQPTSAGGIHWTKPN